MSSWAISRLSSWASILNIRSFSVPSLSNIASLCCIQEFSNWNFSVGILCSPHGHLALPLLLFWLHGTLHILLLPVIPWLEPGTQSLWPASICHQWPPMHPGSWCVCQLSCFPIRGFYHPFFALLPDQNLIIDSLQSHGFACAFLSQIHLLWG